MPDLPISMGQQALTTRTKALIIGDSELAGRIRAHSWSETPLGPIEGWSETLLATVNLMLHSPFPTILSWGPEMVFLYNDAAIPTLTEKHPSALGGLYRDVFHEAWDLVSGDLEACFYRGETAVRDNMFIPTLFHGVLEDHYWSYSLIPVYEGGVIAGVYDAFRNTAEIVMGARRLGELAAIVDSSDDVILSKDLNGIITSWNAAAIRLFGYSAEEMIGSSILKLIPDDLHSDEKTIMDSIRAGRRVEHFETARLTKSGQLIDVSLTISPVRDERGRVIGASKILRDVSIRKRMEQSLLQAEKIAATGRMAATIAHEINNPLEAVMNLLYLIGPMITDPVGISYFQAIDTELGRVAHIAKQTLGYYREHAAANAVAIADIVLHAITIYGPRCTATGIQVKKALHSSRKIVLRRGEMTQVVSNLMVNSIYAMPTGGVLSVSVEDAAEPEDGIVLTIQDDGAGIAEADMPRVFEAFFTTRSVVGTGIGLFVAKQFVEGHGGRIEIESRQGAEDHGTTVRVFLPMSTTYESAGEVARVKD
ncbi:nitrogen regulation protein NR(II) [Granulicella sp. S156]|uniref:two-component system sensor histidine kinase NtrB n=1 Tax=Granulicella sp. S156 TaxID=1747224 RepID=UPI0020B12B05|nr:PAS domain S-box protein [Granulicella sp. S156]